MKSTKNEKQIEDLKPGDELFRVTDKEGNTTIFTLDENLSIEEQLKRYLQFIEDEKNYYAGFPYVIENAVMAKQIAKYLCFNTTVFSDTQYHACLSRIEAAREKAIKTHGVWTIKILEQSKTQHTPRTLVSSVYSDIFGIELKGEELHPNTLLDDPYTVERKKQAIEENWKATVKILKNHYTKEVEYDVENITRDLIFFMFPISDNTEKDRWWEEAARNFILGFVLAQIEDFVEGKLDEDQLNLVDIFKRLINSLADMQKLENYLLQNRLYNFQIKAFTEVISRTQGKTLASYLKEIKNYLNNYIKE